MTILITGAGPAGLTAAVELARRGIMPRVVDKKTQASTLSRAVGINPYSLTLLEASDVTPRLIDKGLKIRRGFFHEGTKKLLSLRLDELPGPCNFLLSLPQDETEKILQQRFEELGGHVEYATEVTDMHITAAGRAQFSLMHDGAVETGSAATVIAADGAHSVIRQAAGISFDGYEYPTKWGIADIDVDGFPYEEMAVHLFLQDGRIGFIIPIGEKRYRIVSSIERAIDSIPHLLPHIKNIRMENAFSIAVKQASSYQKGPFYLAGDAAHVHSPAGALGMNTGIADACALARLIQENRAEGYTALRHPPGKKVIAFSEKLVRMARLKNPWLRALRKGLFCLVDAFPILQRPVLRRIAGAVRPCDVYSGKGLVRRETPYGPLKRKIIVLTLRAARKDIPKEKSPMFAKSSLFAAAAIVALTVLAPAAGHADPFYHGYPRYHHYYPHDYSRGHTSLSIGIPLFEDPAPVTVVEPAPVYYPSQVVTYTPGYAIGQPVVYAPVPQPIMMNLQPAPAGYYYSMGQRQVLVVSHRTNRVQGFIKLRLR